MKSYRILHDCRRCQTTRLLLRPRRGISLLEVAVSSLLLGTVMSIAAPTAHWIVLERQAAHRRQVAGEELSNLMDRLTVEAWDQLTAGRVQELRLAEDIESQLPDSQLQVTVDEEGQAKRIQMQLSWRGRAGRRLAPVRLTTWVYPKPTPKGETG